jgi:hypothetical protein
MVPAAFFARNSLYFPVLCAIVGKDLNFNSILKRKKAKLMAMVVLDQFKTILATYTEPLVEVRDSL